MESSKPTYRQSSNEDNNNEDDNALKVHKTPEDDESEEYYADSQENLLYLEGVWPFPIPWRSPPQHPAWRRVPSDDIVLFHEMMTTTMLDKPYALSDPKIPLSPQTKEELLHVEAKLVCKTFLTEALENAFRIIPQNEIRNYIVNKTLKKVFKIVKRNAKIEILRKQVPKFVKQLIIDLIPLVPGLTAKDDYEEKVKSWSPEYLKEYYKNIDFEKVNRHRLFWIYWNEKDQKPKVGHEDFIEDLPYIRKSKLIPPNEEFQSDTEIECDNLEYEQLVKCTSLSDLFTESAYLESILGWEMTGEYIYRKFKKNLMVTYEMPDINYLQFLDEYVSQNCPLIGGMEDFEEFSWRLETVKKLKRFKNYILKKIDQDMFGKRFDSISDCKRYEIVAKKMKPDFVPSQDSISAMPKYPGYIGKLIQASYDKIFSHLRVKELTKKPPAIKTVYEKSDKSISLSKNDLEVLIKKSLGRTSREILDNLQTQTSSYMCLNKLLKYKTAQ